MRCDDAISPQSGGGVDLNRVLWTFGFLLALSGLSWAAQGEVEIVHDPMVCWPVDQFPILRSSFVPPEDIHSAKFYFRSTEQPDYYYLQLTLAAGGGTAIGPKAEVTTPSVTYYIEIVTRSFNAFRSEERAVPVASGDECRRRDPETAFYNGQNPDIAVGATRVGAAPLPPGFQADGIARFLNATGIAGETGGGVSGNTLAIIGGAGGAGAAALAFTGGGSSDPTTTSPIGGSTSGNSSSSTSTAIGGGSSSTTTASGGGSTSSSTTTIGGGGSTSSTTTTIGGGGSTTTIVGGSTTTSSPTTGPTTSLPTTSIPTSSGPTTSLPTTSVPTSSGPTTSLPTTSIPTSSVPTTIPTSSVPSGAARLQVSKSGPASVSPNTPFTYTVRISNVGTATATAVEVLDKLPADFERLTGPSGCTGSPATNEVRCFNLKIDPGNSATLSIQVRSPSSGTLVNTATAWWGNPRQGPVSGSTSTKVSLRTDETTAERIAVKTFLDIEPYDGRSRGRIVSNDSEAFEVTNAGPVVHHFAVVAGENRVEATLLGGASRSRGVWRFDFSGAPRFVPGSIRVDSGQVYGQGARFVAFTVEEGSSLRFRYQVSDDIP